MKISLRVLFLLLTCILPARIFAQGPPVASSSTPGEVIRLEEQMAKTTEGPNNNAFGSADALTKKRQSPSSTKTKGFQFKNMALTPGVDYHWVNDSAPGGFAGYDVTASLGVDADVYDGFILGVLYGRTQRETENSIGISQHMSSDAVSLYGAKRFFDLMNVGLAYNYANTRDRLSRAVEYNMNRESNGGTLLLGVSDRKDKWSWSSTTSYVYVYDDYEFTAIIDRTSSRFGWTNALGYDVTKAFTLGASLSYYNFLHQDLYSGVAARDDSYWLIGPRLSFYPSDNITVHFDFDSQHGYKDLSAYTVHMGVDVLF